MFIEVQQKSSRRSQQIIDQEQDVHCTFFVFINNGSGSGLGSKIINQQIKRLTFEIAINSQNDIRAVQLFFINLRKNKEYGFKKLKRTVSQGKKTIGIICGGDGTVMWVISELITFGIDPMMVPLGIIPTGTGNDFSRTLNWGGQKTMLLQHNFRSLKKLIRKWLNATVSEFDLWDVTAQVFPNGKFEKVENGQNLNLQTNVYKKTFANYFSFGIDGKIGYSFDIHRASSRIGNLAVYGALGVVKQATKTKTIDQLIQSCYVHDDQMGEICLFKTRLKQNGKGIQQQKSTSYIKPGLKNILALNIDSYTGGVTGIWKQAKQLFGNNNHHERGNCSYSDGKIQLVSFESATAIAMERSIGGFANRVAQHKGPFVFNFRQYPNEEKHRTYLQIDGQFLRFTHPKKVLIQKSKITKQGKIKVLVNNPDFKPYTPEQ